MAGADGIETFSSAMAPSRIDGPPLPPYRLGLANCKDSLRQSATAGRREAPVRERGERPRRLRPQWDVEDLPHVDPATRQLVPGAELVDRGIVATRDRPERVAATHVLAEICVPSCRPERAAANEASASAWFSRRKSATPLAIQ